jgi:ADP-ribose pyrophosphatase
MTSDWKTMQSDLIFQNPWIELYQDKVEIGTGKIRHYTLVMIRQYRYPLHKVLLEFPAGHIENYEDAEKTARRELLEETGYLAKEIEELYAYHPSVSISKQLVHIFSAKNLFKGESKHDTMEDIRTIESVSLKKLQEMVRERKIDSAGTLIAYLICCTGIL